MMNKKLSARLVAFAEGPEARDFLEMAEETFFTDFIGESGAQTLNDIEFLLGDYGWLHIFPCLMEFFLSNDYALSAPGRKDIAWNAIDCFLAGEGKDVTDAERRYLEGLRDSHMSLYRVMETGPGETLKLHDLIENFDIVTEGRAGLSAKMKPGDTFGIRLVNIGSSRTVAGGILPFDPEAAEELATDLHDLLMLVMKALPHAPEARKGEAPLTARDTEHLTRVLLTPEIATDFMLDIMMREALKKAVESMATSRPKRKLKSRKAH
ncbi:MAG: hypothetical protein V1721_09510 [Pseudomonadota bacterium]